MKTEIDPAKLYWATFNRFELRLPGECVIDCSAPGSVDDAVAYWVPRIRIQVTKDDFHNRLTDEAMAAELKEYGAWDAEELADTDQNWHRLVWIAAGNIADEESPDASEPIAKD